LTQLLTKIKINIFFKFWKNVMPGC